MAGARRADLDRGTRWHLGLGRSPPVRLHHLSRTTSRKAAGVPYIAVPGRRPSRTAHIPGADFLDLQGEFSDHHQAALHDAGGRAARSGVRPPRHRQRTARSCSTHRARDVGDAVLVDAAIPRLRRRRRARRRARQVAGRRPLHRDRAGKGYPPATFTARPRGRVFRRQADVLAASTTATLSSSTRSARNSTRAWSPAATAARPHSRQRQRAGRDLLDPATKAFTSLADAATKFTAQGVTKDKHVVAYCGGGISATIDLFLLTGSATTTSRSTTARWANGPRTVAADRTG